MIALKRAYDPPAARDGHRILVERLWPRGIKKAELALAGWNKEVAPSTGLRKWFSHDPAKWQEFKKRYFAELRQHPQASASLLAAARKGRVTLIFSSHDVEHNNATALKQYLDSRLRGKAAA